MLTVTIEVDAPAGLSLAVKESLAMTLEQYGGVRVVDVREGGLWGGKSDQTHPGRTAAY